MGKPAALQESTGPRADSPLFGWDTSTATRLRSPGRVRRAEEHDAAAREEHARREVEEPPRAIPDRELAGARARSPLWGEEMAVAVVGLLLAVLTVGVRTRTSGAVPLLPALLSRPAPADDAAAVIAVGGASRGEGDD